MAEDCHIPPKALNLILRLFLSYLSGTIVATVLWLSHALLGAPETLGSNLGFTAAIILVSAALSYKYLILAIVLALLFRRNIWRHMFAWAAASPFVVTVLWTIEHYLFETEEKDFGAFLHSDGSAAVIVFFYSLIYAAIFYFSNRTPQSAT